MSTGNSSGSQPPRPRTGWRQAFLQLRTKITAPYVLLAVLLAFAATYITTHYIAGSLEERFQQGLQDSGRLAADSLVQVEQRHLVTVRSVAYTEGLAEAVAAKDMPAVRRLAALIALNDGVDCLDVVALDGQALLTQHLVDRQAREYDFTPSASLADWPLVDKVLGGVRDELGDKHIDLVQAAWGWTLYTAGPILLGDQVVGVVLVGSYLDTLVRELDQDALARITLYTPDGWPLASTLAAEPDELLIPLETVQRVFDSDERFVVVRDVRVAGRAYAQVLGPLAVRREQKLGVLSAALPTERLLNASVPARNQLIGVFGAAIVLALALGALLSMQIVRPIQALVNASRKVAGGDFSAAVLVRSSDEVGELSQTFNLMTEGLRERQRERDLFGRVVSPEVRDALLQGKLELGGQTMYATVLFSDIVGFTSMSEKLSPQEVVAFINEYLSAMEPAIRGNGGIVDKYVGDAIVAIFGAPVGHRDDATRAVRAAVEMHAQLAALNAKRHLRGEPPLAHGIGLSTGSVVAGAVGSPERLEYTVIGDAVNVAARLETLTRRLQCEILLTEEVVKALESTVALTLEDKGEIELKGRAEPVRIFELKV